MGILKSLVFITISLFAYNQSYAACTAQQIVSGNYIQTPKMGICLPIPTLVKGPQWATDINNAFLQVLDGHTHAIGSGNPIHANSLLIDNDLVFNTGATPYSLVRPKSVQLYNTTSFPTVASLTTALYSFNGELYYNDASGNNVPITSGGSVFIGSSGNIGGMGGTTAAVTYSNISKTFLFTQDTAKTADITAGTINVTENVTSAQSVSIKSPTSLASAYNITLPAAVPSVSAPATTAYLVSMSTTGQLGYAVQPDNSTIEQSGTAIQIKDAGVTKPKLAAADWAASPSSGGFATNSSTDVDVITTQQLTTHSRPVIIFLQGVDSSGGGRIYTTSGSIADIKIKTTAGRVVCRYNLYINSPGVSPPSPCLDNLATNGQIQYKLTVNNAGSGINIFVNNIQLISYEL